MEPLVDTVHKAVVDADPTTNAQSFQLLGTRSWSHGLLAGFRVTRPAAGRASRVVVGSRLLERRGAQWQVTGGGGFGVNPDLDSSDLVQYCVGSGVTTAGVRYADVVGTVNTPQVAAVEAVFANGHTVRDAVDNGLFLMACPHTDAVVALHLLDTTGSELRRIAVPTP